MIKLFILAVSVCFAFADDPEWVPYVTPMMLGRTFDKSSNQVGVDVIKQTDLVNIETANGTQEFMKFKAGEAESSKRDLLDVSGSLALQIKGGFISVKGSGQYVKDENKGEKYYELLTLVQRKTKVISLASEVEPVPYGGAIIGKHYVSQIQYGANLVASLRFKYQNDEEKQTIKAAIEGSIKDTTGTDSFNIQASADLSKIDSALNQQYSLEIKYYADVQLDDVPQNIDDFKALINRFATLVETTTDGGLGRPIRAYVQPLTALYPNAPEYSANSETHVRVDDLDNEITDMISAKNRLYVALKDKRTLTEEQETWISDFYAVILDATKDYRDVISKLNLESGPSQFTKTNAAYLKIEELDVWGERFNLCPDDSSSKKTDTPDVILANKYTTLAKGIICHIEKHRSDSQYDTQVQKILDIKKTYMDQLDKKNKFIDDVLVLSKDYTSRAKKIFQHYFMATREGEQSGLAKGGTVIFDNVKLQSTLQNGYDTATGEFTAPTAGVYLLSEHVTGTNMDMDRDGKGACPITQGHTKTILKKMTEGETYSVTSDTDTPLIGESSFMGILVEAPRDAAATCDMAKDALADHEEGEKDKHLKKPSKKRHHKTKKEIDEDDDDDEDWHS